MAGWDQMRLSGGPLLRRDPRGPVRICRPVSVFVCVWISSGPRVISTDAAELALR